MCGTSFLLIGQSDGNGKSKVAPSLRSSAAEMAATVEGWSAPFSLYTGGLMVVAVLTQSLIFSMEREFQEIMPTTISRTLRLLML